MSCAKSDNGWCDKENDEDWNYCPDCVVVDAIEALEEQKSELMKENADLTGELKKAREAIRWWIGKHDALEEKVELTRAKIEKITRRFKGL